MPTKYRLGDHRRNPTISGLLKAFSLRRLTSFSLLEVLISLVILLVGILAILLYFPNVLRANDRSMMLSEAAFLAQRKAEEIRRDADQARRLIAEIRSRTVPTAPVVFPENPNLAYSFCGVSLLDPTDDPGDPTDDRGVPRIIVQYAQGSRADSRPLYELRFNE
ncbi:MAG: hypothetical protein N3D11_03085 [Candidatus Sumerlaeia bacterium]|nr:hypothetical protein [Candidatus Sumerlaeia bacterium]